MTDYFIKVPWNQRDTIRDLGCKLYILQRGPDGRFYPVGPHGWLELGEIRKPTGEVDAKGFPVTAPVVDEQGVPYWHANLRFVGDSLMDHCKAIYNWKKSAELKAAIDQFQRFFVYSPELGEAVAPRSPAAVFG